MITILIGIGIIITLFGLLGIIIVCFYNRYQTTIIKVCEAENNIDILLQKKIDLLSRIIPVIEEIDIKLDDDEVLLILAKIKNKKYNNFELNNELNSAAKEFQELIDRNSILNDNSSISEIKYLLLETENDLTAAKKYYNIHVSNYNKYIKCFPSNIIGFFFKYKLKSFYSNEVEEMFEILKKK